MRSCEMGGIVLYRCDVIRPVAYMYQEMIRIHVIAIIQLCVSTGKRGRSSSFS